MRERTPHRSVGTRVPGVDGYRPAPRSDSGRSFDPAAYRRPPATDRTASVTGQPAAMSGIRIPSQEPHTTQPWSTPVTEHVVDVAGARCGRLDQNEVCGPASRVETIDSSRVPSFLDLWDLRLKKYSPIELRTYRSAFRVRLRNSTRIVRVSSRVKR